MGPSDLLPRGGPETHVGAWAGDCSEPEKRRPGGPPRTPATLTWQPQGFRAVSVGPRSFGAQAWGPWDKRRPACPRRHQGHQPALGLCPVAWGSPVQRSAGQRGRCRCRARWGRGGGGLTSPPPPLRGATGGGASARPQARRPRPLIHRQRARPRPRGRRLGLGVGGGGPGTGRGRFATLLGAGKPGVRGLTTTFPGPGALTAAAFARLCCPRPGARPRPADPLPPRRSCRRVSMMKPARLTARALRHRWPQSAEHPAARLGCCCACAHSSSRPAAPLAAGRGGALAPGPVGWAEGKTRSL